MLYQSLRSFIKSRKLSQPLFEIAIILLIAFILRVVNLEKWPRWLVDEGTYGGTGINYFRGHFGPWYIRGFNAPLFLYISGFMTEMFGRNFFILRLPGAVAGTISSLLIFFIARKLYNHFIGVSAALMLTVATTYINRVALMDNFVELFLLLSVFSYLKFRETNKKVWEYILGTSMGFALLSKYTGIMVALFTLVQSLLDRRLSKTWRSFVIFVVLSLIYPIIGVFGIGWNYFLMDLYPPARRTPPDIASFIIFLIMGRPESQLAWEETLRINIWSTVGFFSCFYLLGRQKFGDRFVLTLVSMIIFTYIPLGYYWWGYLAPLYPAYCMAIAVVFHEVAFIKKSPQFLAFYIFLFGSVDLKEGQVDLAKSKLAEIKSALPEANPAYNQRLAFIVDLFQGEILLTEGSVSKAIAVLEKASPMGKPPSIQEALLSHNIPFLKDVLARAYKEKGKLDKAIAEYEHLIKFDPSREERTLIHPLYYFRLAKLYEEKGAKEKAAEKYERFLSLWKNADPGLSDVIEAKNRLAALKIRN